MSIRTRITLFGLSVVTALLVTLCLGIYWLLVASLDEDRDRMLGEAAEQAVGLLARAPAAQFAEPSPGQAGLAVLDPRTSPEVILMVLGPGGTVLDTTGVVDGAPPAVPAGLLAVASAGGSATATIEVASGESLRVHVRPWQRPDLGRSGYVVTAHSDVRPATDRQGVLYLMVFYLVPAFVAAAGAIWMVTGRALRPLGQLATLADEIGSARDLTRRLPPVTTRDVLGRLTISFNTMLERLQEAYRRQAEGLAAQQRFTADASHELRTPLTTIRNNATFLLRHPDAATADREAALRDIAGESERMSRLVDSLLTLARADAGQPLPITPVDLAAVAERVCRQARRLHPEREIHCAVTPTPAVTGSEDALAQLLWIMVDNAVKHTAAGGHVWVTLTQRGDLAQLRVLDDGCGIAPGEQERIFERFHRSDPSRRGQGAGLGLSIAAWIVRVHGGQIVAANNARRGASFVTELPLAPSDPATPG